MLQNFDKTLIIKLSQQFVSYQNQFCIIYHILYILLRLE